ncbi:hypothetical protein [Olivibacter jilunii]|uniref:hypothetical protein n=1 Tax=Olivibacter jilunii TaxID=985016 RepID=UPI0010306891|nr:hypothetical protein [Olivibacter jilunii]
MNSKSNAPALLRQGPRLPLSERGRSGSNSKKREIFIEVSRQSPFMPVYDDFEINDGYLTLFAK